MNGIVFAVDRQYGHSPATRRVHHETTSHYQNFLIGQRDGLPGVDSGEDGLQRGGARGRAEHQLDVWMGRDCAQPRRACLGHRDPITSAGRQTRMYLVETGFGR